MQPATHLNSTRGLRMRKAAPQILICLHGLRLNYIEGQLYVSITCQAVHNPAGYIMTV
jgi:hypothetical protein